MVAAFANPVEKNRERLLAELTETALTIAVKMGSYAASVDLEIDLWNALADALPDPADRADSEFVDHYREDQLAEWTDAAYRVLLRHRFHHNFIEVQLGLRNAFRHVIRRNRFLPARRSGFVAAKVFGLIALVLGLSFLNPVAPAVLAATPESTVQGKEPNVSENRPAETDLVTLPSAHDVTKTAERLRALLAEKKIQLFADVDHAAGAMQAGLDLRPTRVLIFGNPQAGTPLMQSQQSIGLDLPLRVLIWQDDKGKVWLTYRNPSVLAQRHRITDRAEAVKALDAGLAALAGAAAAP